MKGRFGVFVLICAFMEVNMGADIRLEKAAAGPEEAQEVLRGRQRRLANNLFDLNLSCEEALKKSQVSERIFTAWLGDDWFSGLVDKRARAAVQISRMLISRNAAKAAEQLIELMESDKEETARKACLDVLTAANEINRTGGEVAAEGADNQQDLGFDEQTAAKVLRIINEENNSK